MTTLPRRLALAVLVLAACLGSLSALPALAYPGTLYISRSLSGPVPAGTVLGITAQVRSSNVANELVGASVSADFSGSTYLALKPGSVTTRYIEENRSAGTIAEGNAPSDRNVRVDLDAVPAGWTAEVGFRVKVASALPAGVDGDSFVATLFYPDNPLDTPTVQVVSVTILAEPAFDLVKDDQGQTFVPGGAVTYSLTATNSGSRDGAGVAITDTVPGHTRFEAAGSSPGWSCAPDDGPGSVCSLAVGSLGAGQSRSALLVLRADPAPVPAGLDSIRNTARVADDGTASGGTVKSATAYQDTPLVAAPDLALAKSDGGVRAVPGGEVVYTLTYQNRGDQGASGVELQETVPRATTFRASASSSGWSCVPSSGAAGATCTLGVGGLAAGASGSASFAVTVDGAVGAGVDRIVNSASVRDDGGNGADPTPGDERASVTTPLDAAPDLALVKEDGGVTARPGGSLVYTLSYRNHGTQAATGVFLREEVPAHTSFSAGDSTPGWTCSGGAAAGEACSYPVGDLAAGGHGAVSFGVLVDAWLPAGVEAIVNAATVGDDGSNGDDLEPGDNRDTATTPVDAAPDLRVTKSDGGVTARPGGTVVYTLDYENHGDQGATGVLLEETVPVGTSFDAGGSDGGWVCLPAQAAGGGSAGAGGGGASCALDVGELAAGASGSVTFSVVVDPTVPAGLGELTNTVWISDDGTNGDDPDPVDNEAMETTPVEAAPDLSVTKDDGGVTVHPGDGLVYSIAWANHGDQGASGVVLEETVPAGTRSLMERLPTRPGCAPGAGSRPGVRAQVGRPERGALLPISAASSRPRGSRTGPRCRTSGSGIG